MPDSPDLLRDAEVLRKLLTECLRRVDRLERQLRIEAKAAAEANQPPAAPLTDPFEQVLPDDEPAADERVAGNGSGPIETPHTPPTPHRQPPPRPQRAEEPSKLRTLHVARRPEPPADPHATPAAPQQTTAMPRTPGPLDAFGEANDWNPETPSGDGSLDPFALLDLSVSPPESHDAYVSRAMSDLLGRLDITPPADDA